mgnify:CR=1 FL=1
MTDVSSEGDARAERSVLQYVGAHLREYGLLFALIAIMLFFQVVTGGTLLKPVNITNLFLQNSYIIIMALGMLIVLLLAKGILLHPLFYVLTGLLGSGLIVSGLTARCGLAALLARMPWNRRPLGGSASSA